MDANSGCSIEAPSPSKPDRFCESLEAISRDCLRAIFGAGNSQYYDEQLVCPRAAELHGTRYSPQDGNPTSHNRWLCIIGHC